MISNIFLKSNHKFVFAILKSFKLFQIVAIFSVLKAFDFLKTFKVFTFSTLVAIFAIFVISPEINASEQLSITASVEPAEATVGFPVKYFVTFQKSDDIAHILLPEKRRYFASEAEIFDEDKSSDESSDKPKPADFVPVFEIREITEKKSGQGDDVYIDYVIDLIYYRPGVYLLPEVLILDSDNVQFGYKLPQIEIHPVNPDMARMPDELPLDLSGNYTRLVVLIISIILLTIAGVFITKFILKKMKQRVEPEVITPPIEIFEKEIANLNSKNLIDQDRHIDFIFELSHIFKNFLSLSLKSDVLEMTNEEMLRHIDDNMYSASPADRKTILSATRKISMLWDLSKFAEFSPTSEMLETNLSETVDLAKKVIWEAGNVRFRV